MPLLPEAQRRLQLRPIVEDNTAPLGTAYLTPIDHRSVKTGITAEERSLTIRTAADPDSDAGDFVRPGHVMPLLAKEGGVLRRAGHTEATVDLTRMAGLEPVGVLCEVLDDSGQRATRDELRRIADKHQLQLISIEQLIAHRRVSEKLIRREAEACLPTQYGDFRIIVYSVQHEQQQPIALIHGDVSDPEQPTLVRVHSSCFTGDLVGSLRCDCGDQLHIALEMIRNEGRGVLLYLPQEGRGIGLTEKIRAYALQEQGLDTVEANVALGYKADERDYGIGIQILKDVGLRKVRLLTNNSKKTNAVNLRAFDLQVVDQVPIISSVNEYNAQYLATKREKLGHELPSPCPRCADRTAHDDDATHCKFCGQPLAWTKA